MKIVLEHTLVPTDFSEHARAALAYGVALVERFGGSLHLLHVIQDPVGAGIDPLAVPIVERTEVQRAIEEHAWRELEALLSAEERARVRAVLAVEWGLPAIEILRYAKTHPVNLIVMGTHGRTGLQRLLMGSVAEHVVREAPCPVLTVHHPEREALAEGEVPMHERHGHRAFADG